MLVFGASDHLDLRSSERITDSDVVSLSLSVKLDHQFRSGSGIN